MFRFVSKCLGRGSRAGGGVGSSSQKFKLVVRRATTPAAPAATTTTARTRARKTPAPTVTIAASRAAQARASGARRKKIVLSSASKPPRTAPAAVTGTPATKPISTQSNSRFTSYVGVCVPVADLTPLAKVVNKVVFTANTAEISKETKRVNILCLDASRFTTSEDYTKFAHQALIAEIVAALARFDSEVHAQLTAKARQEVYAAPLVIVVTSRVVFQSDAEDQGALVKGALQILRVGSAFSKVTVLPLNKDESDNVVKAPRFTLQPGVSFDMNPLMNPPAPEAASATAAVTAASPAAAADAPASQPTAGPAAKASAADKRSADGEKALGATPAQSAAGGVTKPSPTKQQQQQQQRRSQKQKQAKRAADAAVDAAVDAVMAAMAAANPAATRPATAAVADAPAAKSTRSPVRSSSNSGNAGSGSGTPPTQTAPVPSSAHPPLAKAKQRRGTATYQDFMEKNYPDDLPKHDFLWCFADVSDLFSLAKMGVLPPPPKAFDGVRHSGIASCVNLAVRWRPRGTGSRQGGGAFEPISVANLRESFGATYTRILLAVMDYHHKFKSSGRGAKASPPPYSASMRHNKLTDSLVILVPTNLTHAKAQERRVFLEIALAQNGALADLPAPLVWVMDKEESRRYLASGFAPRVSPKFIALRSQGGPAKTAPASATGAPQKKDSPPTTPPAPTTATATATPAAAKATKATTGGAASSTKPAAAVGTTPAAAKAAATSAVAGKGKRKASPSPAHPTLPALPLASKALSLPPPTPLSAPVPAVAAGSTAAITQTPVSVTAPSTTSAAMTLPQHERVVFKSSPSRPVDPATLIALLDNEHFVGLSRKLVARKKARRQAVLSFAAKNGTKKGQQEEVKRAAKMDGTYHTYPLVYHLGRASTLTSSWTSMLAAAVELFGVVNGCGPYGLPTNGFNRNGRPRAISRAERKRIERRQAALARNPAAGGIYLLVHLDAPVGSEDDVAQLQKEVDGMYSRLSEDVKSDVLLGVRLVPSQTISEANLTFLLQSTALRLAEEKRGGVGDKPAPTGTDNVELQHERRKALATLLAASAQDEAGLAHSTSPLFSTLYRGLLGSAAAMEVADVAAAATASASPSGPLATVTPGLLVSQSACTAAVLANALEKLETRLRQQSAEVVTALQTTQGVNDELTRKAQSVELKNMVTDAVEEVSARHEQATAHLVKSLSAMVNQWSTEKLLDGMEAVLKENLGGLTDLVKDIDVEAYLHSLKDPNSSATQKHADALEKLVTRLANAVAAAESSSASAAASPQLTAVVDAVRGIQRDLATAKQHVGEVVRQELARYSGAPGMLNARIATGSLTELERAIVAALHADGGGKEDSISRSIRDMLGEQAPALMDKIEAGLHRALVAAASQGLVQLSPAAAAQSNPNAEESSSSSSSSSSDEEAAEQLRRQQLQLRHSARRRYALWQRRGAEAQRKQQQQQDSSHAEGASGSALSDEVLTRILREQRAEMMWLMKPYGYGPHSQRRSHRRTK